MQQPSIFTRIIQGEIPCNKIYEDERTLAFLDIHPARPGHTLVVSKTQVDRLEELSPDDYQALLQTVQKVMRRMVEVFSPEYRACLKVEGFDVPHAHIHVIPCQNAGDFAAKGDPNVEADHVALTEMAAKLAF